MLRCFCLLALAQLGRTLRQQRAPDSPPAFFACEEEGAQAKVGCSTERGVPSRQMDELLTAGYRRMQAVLARGRRPLVVHVGADGLRNLARWTDVHLYSHVLSRAGLPPGVLKLAFVEPLEHKSKDFWANIRKLGLDQTQVSLATAMADGSCPSPTSSLYRISPEACRDFHFPCNYAEGWVSKDPHRPLGVVRFWADSDVPMPCVQPPLTDCLANFKKFRHMPNLTDYCQEVRVPCKTLGDVVQEAGAEAEDVAMVVIDAEGADEAILLSLVGDAKFMPGFILWETNLVERRSGPSRLQELLLQKGYKIGLKTGLGDGTGKEDPHGTEDSPNLIAVLP